MRDLPIASELSYLVFEKQRREALSLPLQPHEAHQRTATFISGQRFEVLTERLGGRLALINEHGDGSNSHGR